MKTTFVATVLNEEGNISKLLTSIYSQSQKPDEVIIVDGGSNDGTLPLIKKFKNIKLFQKKGNRAVGRNLGVKKAKGEIILFSDSGCFLDKNWVKNITEPFNRGADVVSGYYSGLPTSNFERSLIPYVLVMPDRTDPNNFLPSARSMAIKKTLFKKLGGFPEKYSNNEDYVFAKMLERENVKISFKKNAIAYWIPRGNIFEAFVMFFKFAMGDAQSGILRPKVILIFLRHIIGFLLVLYSLVFSLLLILYFIWTVIKNYKYVRNWKAIFFLPLIQVASDIAVLTGTIWGTLKKH